MGIVFGLGILWLADDAVRRQKEDEFKQHLTLAHALNEIDMSSLAILRKSQPIQAIFPN